MARFTAWCRLMRDGERTERRLLYPEFLDVVSRKRFRAVVNNSVATYTRPRPEIERKLAQFLARRTTP